MTTSIIMERLSHRPEWQAFQAQIDQERKFLTDRVMSGQLSHDEYIEACGEYRGINRMLRVVTDPSQEKIEDG